MEKEFVPYQESLELKKLGFNEPCFGLSTINNKSFGYRISGFKNSDANTSLAIPTFSQAFRWFRKKHNLVHRIDKDGGWWVCAILDLYDEKEQGTIEIYLENCYPNSYEEAELACLQRLIEITKK